MTPVTFDEFGNLHPFGIVLLDLEHLRRKFVEEFTSSQTRAILFELYSGYASDFGNLISRAFRQWIDGSFTTAKPDPNDIDLVNLVEYSDDLNERHHLLRRFLTRGYSRQNYNVDGYLVTIYPVGDERRESLTRVQLDYWERWFGHDRDGKPKGIVEIRFS